MMHPASSYIQPKQSSLLIEPANKRQRGLTNQRLTHGGSCLHIFEVRNLVMAQMNTLLQTAVGEVNNPILSARAVSIMAMCINMVGA